MPYPSFSNQIAFPCPAYFSEIAAIYCMISTDRQHQLVYSISSLKQVRFITTEQDLSLATRFMLSSLEPIKCMPFSRESVPKFGTLFLIQLKILKRSCFRKKINELLLNFLRSEDDYVEVRAVIKSRGPGISPSYYECGPQLHLLENRRKIEPNEIPCCLIPHLLVVFTWQLEILVTTL